RLFLNPVKNTFRGKKPDHLRYEKRVAIRVSMNRCDDLVGWARTGCQFDELSYIPFGQTPQEHALTHAQPGQFAYRLSERVLAAYVDVAVCAGNVNAKIFELARQKLQQQQRRLVRPVQIVQYQNKRPLPARVLEKLSYAVEKPKSRLLRLESRCHGQVRQPVTNLGHDLSDIGSPGAHCSHQGLSVSLIHIGPDDLHPGPESRRPFSLIAAPRQHIGIPESRIGHQL